MGARGSGRRVWDPWRYPRRWAAHAHHLAGSGMFEICAYAWPTATTTAAGPTAIRTSLVASAGGALVVREGSALQHRLRL